MFNLSFLLLVLPPMQIGGFFMLKLMLDLPFYNHLTYEFPYQENYLKAIFHLIDSEQKVTVNELNKFLNIKMPSVNSMMKNLQKNWVIYESYKPIKVTNIGVIEAARIVKKNIVLQKCFW